MTKAEMFKYAALTGLGMYVIYQLKEDPHSLGAPEKLKEKADNLINKVGQKANLPLPLKHIAKNAIRQVAHDTIDERYNMRRVN